MKNAIFKGGLLAIIITGFLGQSALAQFDGFTFTVGGATDQGNSVSAKGDVLFDFTADTATVRIFNSSADPSDLVAFYILKPIAGNGTLTPSSMSGLADWSLETSAPSFMNGENGLSGLSGDLFFGAVANSLGQNGPGIDHTKIGASVFTFEFDEDLSTSDWLDYFAADQTHHVMVRWQSVGEDGEDSAKFFGGASSGTITPVPEPRLIAPLAVLGILGGVMIRRRIRGRKR
jgi:hypothetical protein